MPEKAFPTGPMYWIRFGLGIVAGLACGVLRLGIQGVIMGLAVYSISLLMPSLLYNVPLRTGGRPRQFYLVGLGTYVAVWLTTWILLNTLIV